jgi:toxin ParE1/3/4
MNYVLSRKAEEDIIDIFETGIEQFGLSQAERYHEQLDQCFRFLAENPLAAHERFEITPPVRIHPVGSHLVIYRVEQNGAVFIIRVRHGHEDWQSNTDTT